MTLALGIDVGTSGVRTAVLDGTDPISMARVGHTTAATEDIDANNWWSAVEECLLSQIAALVEIGRDPKEIEAIAVDGTSGSMVMTDPSIAPVSPALMYNSKGFDEEAERIAAYAPQAHITRGSNSALARAMRLVALSSETPAYLLHQADFIAAKLIGQGGFSDHNNSLKTGFDPQLEHWPSWIENVIEMNLLPQVQAPGAALQPISAVMANKFGFAPTTLVHAGTTDSIAAFLASAPIKEGIAVTSLGSTLAIKLLSSKRIDDPSVGLYSHKLGDLWLVGGASNTGGAVLKSFFSDKELIDLSAQIDVSAPQNLGYYPLLEPGERFPINDPSLTPKMDPRPADDAKFLQALFEGMASIEADCYRSIVNRGGSKPFKIITAGGGAKNATWSHIRAQALGLPPENAKHSEAAVGAARLTMVCRDPF